MKNVTRILFRVGFLITWVLQSTGIPVFPKDQSLEALTVAALQSLFMWIVVGPRTSDGITVSAEALSHYFL